MNDLSPDPPPPFVARPRRSWKAGLAIAAALGAGVYLLFVRPAAHPASASGARGGSGPIPVKAEAARTADLTVRIVALGTVTPVSTATVRSRVDGELQKLFFEEGQMVRQGDPLAQIDPRPFEVAKMQAEAQRARDRALLDNARADLQRFQGLKEEVPSQQVDTQASLVRQYESAIKVDEAQIASAALQLTYAHVTAPISGRVGLRGVDRGNVVHASDASGLAVITQLRPITVLFSIPQDALGAVMKRFSRGDPMPVAAFDRDGVTPLATGHLVTVDNEIDPTTGTVKLRAEFENRDASLFPNQFVNIQLEAQKLPGVTVVPTAAVQHGSVGLYVYTVSPEQTVSVRNVETGASDGGLISISRGLSPGEMVVVDGVDKLREGSKIELVDRNAGGAAGGGEGSRSPKPSSSRPRSRPSTE